MTETRDPGELEPHPRSTAIYGNEVDSDFVESFEEHGQRQPVKVTPESHFTDADATILSGHRRAAAAAELGREVEVETVGPYASPDEELAALLGFNEYRDKTPAQEIREVDEWREVYSESPDLETNSAVEEACKHVSFGTSTYYDGKRVQRAAEDGNEVASEEWEKLEQGEQSIHGAYTTVEAAKQPEQPGDGGEQGEIPDPRGWFGEGSAAPEGVHIEEPVQAWILASMRRFDNLLRQFPLPGSLHTGKPESYVHLQAAEEGLVVHTEAPDRSVESSYTFAPDYFDEYDLYREEGVGMSVSVDDLRGVLSVFSGDRVLLVFSGPEDSRLASSIYLMATDESPWENTEPLHARYAAPDERESFEEAPGWLPELDDEE